MAGIYLDPWVGDEWQHGSATKWKLTERANCPILTYPDKQTKDLYLCHELNLDLLVELGNRGLWPHLPMCTSGPNMLCFWHKKDTDRTHCL